MQRGAHRMRTNAIAVETPPDSAAGPGRMMAFRQRNKPVGLRPDDKDAQNRMRERCPQTTEKGGVFTHTALFLDRL